MSGPVWRRLMRTLRACLAAGVLATVAAGCSTGSTVFGGNRPPLTGSIALHQTTVRTGRLLHAELVLHNSSGHPILLFRGCVSQFAELVLSHGKLTTGAAFLTPLCRPGLTFIAHPGTTIYRLDVAAQYGSCSPTEAPRCTLSGDGMPDLPSGSYRVTVAADSMRLQHVLTHVRSGRVRVTR